MDEITRVKTIDEAFRAVQKRTPFVLHYLPNLRFFYLPSDDNSGRLVVACSDRYPEPTDYAPALAEMGIFVVEPSSRQFMYNGWHCIKFGLERHALV